MGKAVEIADLINDLPFDIKAEVLIADLMENGLSTDEFAVIPSGSFRRKYSTDIRKAEIISTAPGVSLLGIHVNRNGMYDSLPEGLFHSAPEKPLRETSEMSQESKRLKREEKEARTFFIPFENEIFLHRIALELAERRILRQFSDHLFEEISPEFWNFDKTLHPEYVSKLILLLHHAHQVAGNFDLTGRCLELVLDEKVNIRVHQPGKISGKQDNPPGQQGNLLGNGRLGMNFICGDTWCDLMPKLEVRIGPLMKTPVSDFLGSGKVTKFLDCFYSYFIPSGMEVGTVVVPPDREFSFILDKSESEGVLGYSTAI
jgi:hypothetical protein